jgi:hypothetical protein
MKTDDEVRAITRAMFNGPHFKEAMADLLIERLNEIAGHDPVAMGKLIDARVPCNDALADHPSVQVHDFDDDKPPVVGMLGILNGLVGTIDDGPKKGWGFITAVCEDDGSVSGFRRTDA